MGQRLMAETGQIEHNRLEQQLQCLRDVLNVAQTVVSTLELDGVLQNIVTNGMDLLSVPAGSVALYEEETQEMVLHAHAGLSQKFVARKSWKVKSGGLTQRILNNDKAFVVEDTRKVDFFNNPLAVEEGIRSLVGLPLIIKEKIVGILYLDDFKSRSFDGQKLEVLEILRSFAAMSIANARLHEQTRQRACTDGLTGLYNHRQFKELFAMEMSRAERFGKPMSLVMLDVDNFKKFNDAYGHQVGDQVLATLARLMRQSFREIDLICRYGGEEFIVILPGTDLDKAIVACERVRSDIEEEATKGLEGVDRAVTVSIGVASYPRDGKKLEFLLKVVDDLLYGAKKLGKNKVYYVKRD